MNWQTARILCIDTETTGPDPEKARVVELGAFFCDGGAIDSGVRFGQLVNPKRPIPSEASAIHGIRDEHVADKQTIAELADRLIARVNEADVLAGYNWPYDRKVLENELGDDWLAAVEGKPVLDALTVVRLDKVGRWWKGKGRHKLSNAAERLGIQRRGNAHRASSDAELAARILFACAEYLPADAHEASEWLSAQRKAQESEFEAYMAKQGSAA